MFNLKETWGNHKIFNYDIKKHPFINYLKELFNENELDNLHLKSQDFNEVKDVLNLGYLNDKDTDLHNIYYKDLYMQVSSYLHSVTQNEEHYPY